MFARLVSRRCLGAAAGSAAVAVAASVTSYSTLQCQSPTLGELKVKIETLEEKLAGPSAAEVSAKFATYWPRKVMVRARTSLSLSALPATSAGVLLARSCRPPACMVTITCTRPKGSTRPARFEPTNRECPPPCPPRQLRLPGSAWVASACPPSTDDMRTLHSYSECNALAPPPLAPPTRSLGCCDS